MGTKEADVEAELLRRWQLGDHAAGRSLFERCFGALYRFCANKVASRPEIEDVIQETFLACVEGRANFQGRSSFRTFLFAVARNTLLNRARRAPAVRIEESRLLQSASMVEGLCRREEERILLRALRQLPTDLQIAVELAYWERMSNTQLAELFDVPLGTMKSRLRKARGLLRDSILELASTPGGARSTADNLEKWSAALRALIETSRPS